MDPTERRTAPHVLLVEDDERLAAMVSDGLRARGYVVWHVESGSDAESALHEVRPDLILLDLMLPDRNGLVLCAKLKAAARVPVIICSATKRRDDAVIGFQLGADDFVAKPFSIDELQARIDLALQRGVTPTPDQGARRGRLQRVGPLTIDTTRCRVTVADQVLNLTPTEYRLLAVLAARPAEVVARQELAERVWGFVDEGVIRSLDVHMRRLRAKITAAAAHGPSLVTRRGFGFQLVDGPNPTAPLAASSDVPAAPQKLAARR